MLQALKQKFSVTAFPAIVAPGNERDKYKIKLCYRKQISTMFTMVLAGKGDHNHITHIHNIHNCIVLSFKNVLWTASSWMVPYSPASRIFVITVASKSGVYPSKRKLPLRMGTPATGILSLIAIDFPNSIPLEAPLMFVFLALLVEHRFGIISVFSL